jgi:adenine-specific DNA glycosylase
MRAQLLAWYQENQRPLPWRETTDPYEILVSEVMLQQKPVLIDGVLNVQGERRFLG